MVLSDEFYLVDQSGNKKISVDYCRSCGDRYYFFGINGTEFQDVREKLNKREILKFADEHKLEIKEVK